MVSADGTDLVTSGWPASAGRRIRNSRASSRRRHWGRRRRSESPRPDSPLGLGRAARSGR